MPVPRNIITETLRAYVFVLACCALAYPQVSLAQTTDGVTSGVNDAMIFLQKYDADHSLVDLKVAVERLGGAATIDLFSYQNYAAQRRTLVRGFVKVLKAIELAYDPSYDPDALVNRPEIGCLEIATYTGPTPVCDPSRLKDANAKMAYAAAVAANKRKITRERAYYYLLRLDHFAMATLEVHMRQLQRLAPDNVGEDYAALNTIVREANLSLNRERRIEAMFYLPPTEPGPSGSHYVPAERTRAQALTRDKPRDRGAVQDKFPVLQGVNRLACPIRPTPIASQLLLLLAR